MRYVRGSVIILGVANGNYLAILPNPMVVDECIVITTTCKDFIRRWRWCRRCSVSFCSFPASENFNELTSYEYNKSQSFEWKTKSSIRV